MAALGIIISLLASVLLCALVVVSTWMFFQKHGKPGWAALIPVYREVVMWQISELPLYYILVGLLVPVLGTFYIIAIYMHIAQKFNKRAPRAFGIGMYILPFIFMPILGFSKDQPKKDRKPCVMVCGILLLLFTLFIIVATVPWDSLFTKFTAFSNFNAWLGKTDILKYILAAPTVADQSTTTGIIPVLGSWQLMDLSIFLIVISLLVVAFSDVELNGFIPDLGEKIKKALPIGFITIVISLVLIILITSGVNVTLVNAVTKASDKFNILGTIIGSVVGAVTTADFYYYLSTLYITFKAAAGEAFYPVSAFVVQAIFYLAMIVAPTSVGLLIGLSAFDISYGSWFKYIWKALLAILFLVVMMAIVFYLVIAKHVLLAVVVGVFGFIVLAGILVLIVTQRNKK